MNKFNLLIILGACILMSNISNPCSSKDLTLDKNIYISSSGEILKVDEKLLDQ